VQFETKGEKLFGTKRIRINDLPFGLQIIISRSRILSLLTGSIWFGVNRIDRELYKLMSTNSGFFVELGGNDGLNQSNTKHLELFRGWKGVLIEPFPKNFHRMTKTRSDRTVFVNAACVSFDYSDSEMILAYSNLMTTPLAGESDIIDRNLHAISGSEFLQNSEKVHTFMAKAMTLNKILDDCGAPKVIDLLSLDVEGGELEVLKGVDFSRYQFSWMMIESRSPLDLKDFLENKGYKYVCQLSVHDYVFTHSSNLQSPNR